MKFLAILKDSLREAIDAKVFYVMVGLSVLIMLLTATLSFKPGSGEIPMQLLAVPLTVGDLEDLRPERLLHQVTAHDFRAYEVKAAVPLNGAPEGPDSPYLVTMVAHCQSDAEAKKVSQDPAQAKAQIKDRFGKFDELHALEVIDVRLAPPENQYVPKPPAATDIYFEVQTKPLPAARRLWPHEPSLFFGALPLTFLRQVPLGVQLWLLEDKVVNGIGAWIAILISIIITAFFVPNMLRKGTVDLLLVKPLHRTVLLLYKFVGGLLFIFLNTAVAVFGVWLALSWRSGVWAPGFLLTVLVITAFFAILYSVSTLFAVLTRSPVAAILLTCFVWFVLYIVGALYQFGEALRQQEERQANAAQRADGTKPDAGENAPLAKAAPADDEAKKGSQRRGEEIDVPFRSDNWFFNSVRAIHFVLPRTTDLDHLMERLLIRDLLTANQVKAQKLDDTRISWGESLTVSGIFVGLMLGLSCLWFATRDY